MKLEFNFLTVDEKLSLVIEKYQGSILRLIDKTENVDLKVSNCLYATSNWFVARKITQEQRDVIQLEDLISQSVIASTDAWQFHLMENWFQGEGIDWTIIDGISLGQTHWYDLLGFETRPEEGFIASRGFTLFLKTLSLLTPLLETMRPRRIEHDWPENDALKALETVARHFQIPLFRLEGTVARNAKQLQQQWNRKSWEPTLRLALSRLKRRVESEVVLRLNKPTYDVFLVAYPMMDLVLPALRSRDLQGLTDRILNPRLYPKRHELKEARLRCQPIETAWETTKLSPQYQQKFEVFGINCWPYFEAVFDELVKEEFVRSAFYIGVMKRELQARKIRLMMVPYDSPAFVRRCVQAASQIGVPSLLISHGFFSNIEQSGDMRYAQYVGALCEADIAEIQQIRGYPMTESARVVGCLQYARHPPVLARQPAQNRKLRVLVLTVCPHFFSIASRSTESEIFLETAVAALNQNFNEIEVNFKLHPVEDRNRYERSLALLAPDFVYSLRHGWGLEAILAQSDIVIAPISTAMLEALYLGVPVLFLHTVNEPIPKPLRQNNAIPMATDVRELTNLLEPAIKNYPNFLENYDFQQALAPFGPADADAVNRVVDFAVEILAAKTA